MRILKILFCALVVSAGCTSQSEGPKNDVKALDLSRFSGKGAAVARLKKGGFIIFPQTNRVVPEEIIHESGVNFESLEALRNVIDTLGKSHVGEFVVESTSSEQEVFVPLLESDRVFLGL